MEKILKTTIVLSEKEIKEIIKQHLLTKGITVNELIGFYGSTKEYGNNGDSLFILKTVVCESFTKE